MKSIVNLRNCCLAAIVACGMALSTGTVSASDCHPPQFVYKTVIIYETVRQPVVKWIIKYDHCDQPYLEKVVTYKIVQIPVEKRIRIAL